MPGGVTGSAFSRRCATHRSPRKFKMVALPVIDRLPDDPEWEKTELAFARHAATKLPPFEE